METNKTNINKKKHGPGISHTNNPNGRAKGSKNKITYDIRKLIWEKVSDKKFIKSLWDDIDSVNDSDKRAKLKLELVKMFVPRPLNEDEIKDKDIRSAIWNQLSGKKKEDDSETSGPES